MRAAVLLPFAVMLAATATACSKKTTSGDDSGGATADAQTRDAGSTSVDAARDASATVMDGGPDAAVPFDAAHLPDANDDAGTDAAPPDAGHDASTAMTFLVATEGTDQLVRLDTATAAATPIGMTSMSAIFALSFDPTTGLLYGLRQDFAGVLDLVTIDPCTAAVTLLSHVHMTSMTLHFVEGFAVNPANGIIYMTGGITHTLPDSSSEALLTLDPTSGVATFVADHTSVSGDLDALCFVGGVLYATDVEGPTSNFTYLYTVNPVTAVATPVGTPSTPSQVGQFTEDPVGHGVFASDAKPTHRLETMNLATNVYTPIGDVPNIAAVAFVTATCP